MSRREATISCPACGKTARTTAGPKTMPRNWWGWWTGATLERVCSEKCLRERKARC